VHGWRWTGTTDQLNNLLRTIVPFEERKIRRAMIYPLLLATCLFVSVAYSQDIEMRQGSFKSENNLIEEVHFETGSGKTFIVLKLKNKLSGKNSRARTLVDKRANYGDSLSSYAYFSIKDDPIKAQAILEAHVAQLPTDLIYNCGEQPDDKRRKAFPYFVETNCEVEAFTIKASKEKKGRWY
jgi:hypothetical protein